ncbi:MAG TPA: hypothetical protein PLV92_26265, partial [Pirellulaceae bacterium]|nr:hypothetical protein [Pirellulaceae bacterium]
MAEAAITTLDLLAKDDEDSLSSRGPLLAVGAVDGQASVHSTKQNAATGELRLDESARLTTTPTASKVVRVLLTSAADNAWVVWQDGSLDRFDIRDLAQPRCVERASLFAIKSSATRPAAQPEASTAMVTVCEWALGRETLLVGDSTGGLNAWFRVRAGATESSATPSSDAKTPASDSTLSAGGSATASRAEFESDGFELVRAHRLPSRSTAVTALAASPRSRLAAAGYADGHVVALHVTTENRLAEAVAVDQEPVRQLQLTAKEDAIVASTSRGLVQFDLDARHPEATLAALFAPVWYEGYREPRHVWQSSFAGVEPEMKLGLWPLVFGTLKATFYSLLFSAPIALLAALHTSEFMTPTLRSRIKPAIEMMASLPSVVLGFLAALVFAPVIEQAVAGVLTSLIAAPLAVL